MRFTPMNDDDSVLLPESEYKVRVHQATDKISQKGNEMIEIILEVKDEAGNIRFVTDYLLEAFKFKLSHFCKAIGLEDKLKKGFLDPIDCLNKSLIAKIGVSKGKQKEGSDEFYADKNGVIDYMPLNPNDADDYEIFDGNEPRKSTSGAPDEFDDDLPF